VETAQFDYIHVGGAWVLAHADMAYFALDGFPTVQATYVVDPNSVRINEPIDPQVFTFEALGVRRGALVHDYKTGEEYLYDDVPLEVKVALAQARELEEQAAAEQAASMSEPMEAGQSPEDLPNLGYSAPPVTEESLAEVGAPPPAPSPTSPSEPVRHKLPQPDAQAPRPGEKAASSDGPKAGDVVVLEPSRPAPTPETTPAEATGDVKVVATQSASGADERESANPASGTPGSRGLGGVVVPAALSAACAAVVAIALWKLTHRTAAPRPGG